ncbi:MAG: fructose-bisphosphate aldolase class I [Chloroflexi bacterium]|nr:fructose-bisphosphate aldolase class I [Chloroflexota bacterium]MCI0864153.1 fructose-bisphosphate aldolase class I [Chloroflexota bacterium]MCI0901301.1 fructose-bisphosphate aldolase class I [Chloroflexota bacterium]MCI0903484.1 fructose-bisphosphate aldolase class I [Chloroflexota bacterium]
MDKQKLVQTAQALVAEGKGILAADESSGTIKRRFDGINTESTEDSRRNYREMLFRTAGVSEFISGVILFDETIRQDSADGTPMVKVLSDQGIIPGIKVDKGTVPLPEASDELVTEGLDGLRDRLKEYVELGAGFTKWRAVISISGNTPTSYGLAANAHALARFAALSQEAGLVPIVEPEILRDGDHDIDRCFEVTEETLREVFDQLAQQKVLLEGMLLKPSMVISGGSAEKRAEPREVAQRTIECFKRVLPASVPGIVFLSGGEPDDSVTANLNALNQQAAKAKAPWEFSFSFGRSLQGAPLAAWAGKAENIEAASVAFYTRARLTGAARKGAA